MNSATRTTSRRYGVIYVMLTALVAATIMGSAFANSEILRIQRDAGQVPMANVNYAGWNYSPLDRINTFNVNNLEVKWTFQLGVTDSLEAPPIVIGNTMYILTPKPNTVYALDLANEGYLLWSYRPEMPGREQAIACCGAQSRGLSYADGKIIFNTLDGQLIALDADTGEPLWNVQVTDLSITETTTNAPLIVDDLIIIGNEGGERGIRGWVAGYDLNTGEERWKAYSTGPNEDMLITDRFQPFYATDQVENPGTSTWFGDSWRQGGGTAWGYFTYDSESNLFYYGTANCAPWNPDYRRDPATAPGLDEYTSKYCAALLARDATTGELVWAYSHTPQDQWDFDEPGQNILADVTIDGVEHQALLKPARNGIFYVFDRLTGEMLLEPWEYTTVSWSEGVDMATGMPHFEESTLVYTDIPTEEQVCPFIAGNNWYNDAYSPRTGLVYFAAENRCATFTGTEGAYVPGESFLLMSFSDIGPGPGGWAGELQAWDPVTGQKAWGLKAAVGQDNKPVMVTAGDLVFGGTDSGLFRAVNARNGEVLWTFRTGSDFRGSPISYQGPDGRQYLAVITSKGPSDPQIGEDTAADNAGRYRRAGTTLYVFGLP
jgi:PQQ-dependent dehydrogenase (methanol/ethanol family)